MSSRHDSATEWLEDEIAEFGDIYDIVTEDNDLVYRYLTNWYVTRSLSIISCPVPLPSSAKELSRQQETENKYIIHGELVPKDPSGKNLRIKLEFGSWGIDFRSSFRGIWITTEQASYWLREPSKERREVKLILKDYGETPMNAVTPSQERQHLELRALFGLVSNLFDIFLFNEDDQESHEYRKMHIKTTPQVVHNCLKASSSMIAQYPNRAEEAFDLELLKRYPSFVKLHLAGLHEDFSKSCVFMQNLQNPSSQRFHDEDFENSAQQAEARSSRTPFGELRTDIERIDPNWVVKERLGDAGRKLQGNLANPPRDNLDVDACRKGSLNKASNGNSIERQTSSTKAFDLLMLSTARMEEALDKMSDIVEALPTGKVNVDNIFDSPCCFSSVESAAGVAKEMTNGLVHTWEHKLLIAKCINGACCSGDIKSARQFVKGFLKDKDGDSGMKILCEVWAGNALEQIKTAKNIPSDSLLFHVLLNVTLLIENCKVISKASQLDNLKGKRGIDWEQGITKISTVSNKATPDLHRKLTVACNKARCRLAALRSQDDREIDNSKKDKTAEKENGKNEELSKKPNESNIEDASTTKNESKNISSEKEKSATNAKTTVNKKNEYLMNKMNKVSAKGEDRKKRGTELRKNLMKERLKQSMSRSISLSSHSHQSRNAPTAARSSSEPIIIQQSKNISPMNDKGSQPREKDRTQRNTSSVAVSAESSNHGVKSSWKNGNSWDSKSSKLDDIVPTNIVKNKKISKNFSPNEGSKGWGEQATVIRDTSHVELAKTERFLPREEISRGETYNREQNAFLSDPERDNISSRRDHTAGQDRNQTNDDFQGNPSFLENRNAPRWGQREELAKPSETRNIQLTEEFKGESSRTENYANNRYSQVLGKRLNQSLGVENVCNRMAGKNLENSDTEEGRPKKYQRLSEPIGGNRGHGMGRGKQTTLPAWMTKKEREVGSSTIHAHDSRRSYQHQSNHLPQKNDGRPGPSETQTMGNSMQRKQGPFFQSNNNAPSRGRGRGLAMTRPAWMTNKQTGMQRDQDRSQNHLENSPGYNVEPFQGGRENVTKPIDPKIKPVVLPSDAPSVGAGRGRGRTLPAWVTKNGRY